MGVLFNGTSQNIVVANESFFDFERTDAFSVACWMYREPLAASGGGALLVGKAGPPGWALDQNDFGSGNYVYSLHLINSPGNELWKFSPTPAPGTRGIIKGTWQHVAATYDGSSTLAGIKLYLNGVDQSSGGTGNLETLSSTILTNQPLQVGGISAGPEWFDGAIAVPVVADYVWTPTEVANLANPNNIGADLNTLLAAPPRWWATLTSPSDLADRSGNGNNGTAVGSPTTFAGPSVLLDTFPAQSSSPFTTSTSWSYVPHVAALDAVVVTIKQNVSATDRISAVTYGGVAMTRVAFAQDSAGEPGCVYAYALTSGVPSGTQTVTVTVSAGTEANLGASYGLLTSAGARVFTGTVQGDTANPTVTLSTPSTFEGFAVATVFSGLAAPSNITAGAAFEKSAGIDFGNQAGTDQCGQISGANAAVAFTATSDDVAMIALAVQALAALLEPGSFSVTGNNATLELGLALNAQPGSYTFTGTSASLITGRSLEALPGTFAVTGTDANVSSDTSVNAATGTFAVTGTAAALVAGRSIAALSDGYLVSGATADLIAVGAGEFLINADPGDYDITGADTLFAAPSSINASPGAYTVTGNTANLSATIPGVVTYLAGDQGFIADYGRGRIRELAGRLS
jgi:hypothetical protein